MENLQLNDRTEMASLFYLSVLVVANRAHEILFSGSF